MSEIKTKIRTYNDVIDLFGEEKAADMLSEALDWSTIDPKNDKKNIMERKPLLLDPYMTYEGEDYCKHIVAGFLGDRDLDWASGYIDEEKIKNGQVMPADLKSALSMALDNELSTSWAYLDALSSQYAEIFNKFAGYIESAGLARGVLVPGEYELDHDALNADVSERFNIQYGFQCDQMIDAMQFDMTLILTEKVDNMDDYKKIPFDDPDLCVPDLDDFDQMKEFFLDCAAEYFRYLSSDDMEKMLAALGKRVDVLATPTDDVFISVSPDAVLRQYPDITIDEAIQIRDNACENIWESGGQSDLDEIVWDQIGAEYKSIKSDSHRGLSDVKDAKAKQAVHVNDDRENDAVALDVQEK